MTRGFAILHCLLLAGGAAADEQALDAVNALRAAAGRNALDYSERLEAIAAGHAADMARRRVMSHESADGSGPGERARARGYRFCRIAENVAQGQRSLSEVIYAWSNSRGHRRNLLDRRVTEMGLARAPGDFWVMVLARPGC